LTSTAFQYNVAVNEYNVALRARNVAVNAYNATLYPSNATLNDYRGSLNALIVAKKRPLSAWIEHTGASTINIGAMFKRDATLYGYIATICG
jgi:hypothetical protein